MVIDDPALIADVRAVFDRCESAIAENGTAVPDEGFRPDPRTLRFSVTWIPCGIEATRAFRASAACGRAEPRA